MNAHSQDDRTRKSRSIKVKKKTIGEADTKNLKIHSKEENGDRWSVYVDGSSTQESGGAGILLFGLGKEEFKYFIRSKFLVTNNVAKYETLLSGLSLAKKIQARKIILFTDSQFIA